MNLPNKLTLIRISITPLFIFFLSVHFPGNYTIALILFIGASITDYLDGFVARSQKMTTTLGKLLDPVADKILVSSAFICFIGIDKISVPAWVVIIIISRELAITGLRLLAAGEGEILSAGRWGKQKTLSQILTIIVILCYMVLSKYPSLHIEKYHPLLMVLVGITTALTLFSGGFYFLRNRRIIKDS